MCIRDRLGNDRVILGLSGGVDSSVAAVLLQRAIGKNLTCIFVDHGPFSYTHLPAPPTPSKEEVLLTEIRDLLKEK